MAAEGQQNKGSRAYSRPFSDGFTPGVLENEGMYMYAALTGAISIMGASAVWYPSQETYRVSRWGKGKEELGTRITLYSYRIYVGKSTLT